MHNKSLTLKAKKTFIMKNLDQLKLCVSLQNSLFNNFLAPKISKSGHMNVFPIYFLKKIHVYIRNYRSTILNMKIIFEGSS